MDECESVAFSIRPDIDPHMSDFRRRPSGSEDQNVSFLEIVEGQGNLPSVIALRA